MTTNFGHVLAMLKDYQDGLTAAEICDKLQLFKFADRERIVGMVIDLTKNGSLTYWKQASSGRFKFVYRLRGA